MAHIKEDGAYDVLLENVVCPSATTLYPHKQILRFFCAYHDIHFVYLVQV